MNVLSDLWNKPKETLNLWKTDEAGYFDWVPNPWNAAKSFSFTATKDALSRADVVFYGSVAVALLVGMAGVIFLSTRLCSRKVQKVDLTPPAEKPPAQTPPPAAEEGKARWGDCLRRMTSCCRRLQKQGADLQQQTQEAAKAVAENPPAVGAQGTEQAPPELTANVEKKDEEKKEDPKPQPKGCIVC